MRTFIKLSDTRLEVEKIVTYKPNIYSSSEIDYFYDSEFSLLKGWKTATFNSKKERDEALEMLDKFFIK